MSEQTSGGETLKLLWEAAKLFSRVWIKEGGNITSDSFANSLQEEIEKIVKEKEKK